MKCRPVGPDRDYRCVDQRVHWGLTPIGPAGCAHPLRLATAAQPPEMVVQPPPAPMLIQCRQSGDHMKKSVT
jgi:hypothetical protein